MKRHKLGRKASKRKFNRTARSLKAPNTWMGSRGGIRF